MSGANKNGSSRGASSRFTEVPVECLICAEPCRAICVFACGHSTCYSCGLHIHTLNHGSCPVCRKTSTEMPIITQLVSKEEEQYSAEEMENLRKVVVTDRRLQCVMDSPQLATEIAKLYEYLCPIEGCWKDSRQDPFVEMAMLKDHLKIDHELAYCETCLQHRPAFLCEQFAYSQTALQHHMDGTCSRDRSSFTGHPPCRFCKRQNRFYDGEALLKHMQQKHYTCDVCNRGQFTFTFYDTRQRLDQHFQACHKICDHPDCANLDLMMRVFGNEIDLMVHKQRVHGIKSKATFSPAMFGEAASGPGTSGGALGSAPATASNTNATQITFDHVYRVETVDLMAMKQPAHNHHGRGGRHGNNSKEKVHAPAENGLPLHYLKQSILPILKRTVAEDSPAARSSQVANNRRGGGNNDSNNNTASSKNEAEASPNSAFGVAEDMSHYNAKNKLPTDKRQLEDRLNQMLNLYLSSPVAYAHFRGYTRDFIDSRIMTSEYYDVLALECFPDARSFHSIFPLIVATIPNAAKKSALQEVYKMRMAPETQRIARAREEDARKEAEAQEAAARTEEQRRRSSAKNNGSSNAGGGGGVLSVGGASPFGKKSKKGNAWATTDMRTKIGVVGGAQHQDPSDTHTPPSSSPVTSVPSASPKPHTGTSASRGWASPAAAASSSSPTSAGASAGLPGRGLVINEENFPSLPSNSIRRPGIGKKQQAKPNAWFSR